MNDIVVSWTEAHLRLKLQLWLSKNVDISISRNFSCNFCICFTFSLSVKHSKWVAASTKHMEQISADGIKFFNTYIKTYVSERSCCKQWLKWKIWGEGLRFQREPINFSVGPQPWRQDPSDADASDYSMPYSPFCFTICTCVLLMINYFAQMLSLVRIQPFL